MDLNLLADTLERFSDIGVIGCALLFVIAIVTGQLYTKRQVDEIRTECAADIATLTKELARAKRSRAKFTSR